MALFGAVKYAGATYGASTPANLRWGLIVDWDDDGFYDSSNEAEYMTGMTIERGRQSFIEEGGSEFVPLSIGRATVTLRNRDGRFNPYNTGSPLYPNVGAGRFAQIQVRSGATTYILFSGVIQEIRAQGYNQAVELVIEDGLRWLSDASVTSEIYTMTDAGSAIDAVLDLAQWPGLWGRDIAAGADVLDFWWAEGRPALDEIQLLADAEIGRLHVDAEGAIVYRSRHTTETSALSIDESELLANPIIPQPWSFRRNSVKVKAHPRQAQASGEIWRSRAVYAISPGATQVITAELGEAAVNLITPVAITDYQAWSQSSGVGTDLTGSLAVTMAVEAQTATLQVINTGAVLAYLTFLQVRGEAVDDAAVSATSSGSGSERRPRMLDLDLAWQQDANNPQAFADALLAFLNATSPFPRVQIEARPDVQFAADLFDLVTVSLATIGIADTYRLGFIYHEWLSENGQAVRTEWGFEPRMTYDYWRFDDDAILDTSILGW